MLQATHLDSFTDHDAHARHSTPATRHFFLSPIIPTHTRQTPVSLIIPTLTQNRGVGVPSFSPLAGCQLRNLKNANRQVITTTVLTYSMSARRQFSALTETRGAVPSRLRNQASAVGRGRRWR